MSTELVKRTVETARTSYRRDPRTQLRVSPDDIDINGEESLVAASRPKLADDYSFEQLKQNYFREGQEVLRGSGFMIANGGNLSPAIVESVLSNENLFSAQTSKQWAQFFADFVSGKSTIVWNEEATTQNRQALIDEAVYQIAEQRGIEAGSVEEVYNEAEAVLHKNLLYKIIYKEPQEQRVRRTGSGINLKQILSANDGFNELSYEQKYYIVDALMQEYLLQEDPSQNDIGRFIKIMNQLKSFPNKVTLASTEAALGLEEDISPELRSRADAMVEEAIGAIRHNPDNIDIYIEALAKSPTDQKPKQELSQEELIMLTKIKAVNDPRVSHRNSVSDMRTALKRLALAYWIQQERSTDPAKQVAIDDILDTMTSLALTIVTEEQSG